MCGSFIPSAAISRRSTSSLPDFKGSSPVGRPRKWSSSRRRSIPRGSGNRRARVRPFVPLIEAFGKRIDREYAETRAKWERLYEATQTKGDGEAHPFLSPNDEFADFERWDKGNLDGSVAKKNEMLEFEYARSALKNGLKLERDLARIPTGSA